MTPHIWEELMPSDIVLALDIGGPIIDCRSGSTLDEYRAAPETAHAIPSLAWLVRAKRFKRVLLISQCSPELEKVKRQWFIDRDVYDRTELSEGDVYFCRKPEDKAMICRTNAVTHFVDDRIEILRHALMVPHLYAFNPSPAEFDQHPGLRGTITTVKDWPALMHHLEKAE